MFAILYPMLLLWRAKDIVAMEVHCFGGYKWTDEEIE